MDSMKKSVSFSKDEKHIYDFAEKKLSFSIYVKELILKDMQGKEKAPRMELNF